MEIHVYLNGKLRGRTLESRERTILRMRREQRAWLFRETVMNTPRSGERYIKMRFVTPRD